MDENGLYPSIAECGVPIYRCKFHYEPDYKPMLVLLIILFVVFLIIPCFIRVLNKILFQEYTIVKKCLCSCIKKTKNKANETLKINKVYNATIQSRRRMNKKGIIHDHPMKKGMKNKSIYDIGNLKQESENDIPYTLRKYQINMMLYSKLKVSLLRLQKDPTLNKILIQLVKN